MKPALHVPHDPLLPTTHASQLLTRHTNVAEEVGVEHMLRDINDPSVSALGADVRAKLGGLKGLMTRLGEISSYLAKVSAGQLPPNLEALYLVQQASRRALICCESRAPARIDRAGADPFPFLTPACARRCLRCCRTCPRSRCARASSRW